MDDTAPGVMADTAPLSSAAMANPLYRLTVACAKYGVGVGNAVVASQQRTLATQEGRHVGRWLRPARGTASWWLVAARVQGGALLDAHVQRLPVD